ncbi:MAG: UbiA family prenyltransferase [Verrucomicrobia bacterium]|nr:UbiA family prenyltransferase [Verrucomicrobiota bacterium]
MKTLRALLVLGRVSNLPTVWSNCLAAWLLGGGGDWGVFAQLCLGATYLYLGGMFLNDAFDAEFDRQHRAERPIPAGVISTPAVWGWGIGWLVAGLGTLALLGRDTALLAVVLTAAILLYDAVHKKIAFAPVLMALCRFFLYLVAASTSWDGINGLVVWSAAVLAAYIVGLSHLARRESAPGALQYWPCVLLAAPLVLAWIVNDGGFRQNALVLGALLGVWIVRCLRSTLWTRERNIGRTVSGLLAGIALVDSLAVASAPPQTGLIFLVLFGAALLFQRVVPAT